LVFGAGDFDIVSDWPTGQEKIDHILILVRNEEKEHEAIKSILESHNQQISEVRKGTSAFSSKIEKLSEISNEVIRDCREIKQRVRELVEKQQKTSKRKTVGRRTQEEQHTYFWVGRGEN
jgi:chromosome segregation ATPase